jgi:hypothetical protein
MDKKRKQVVVVILGLLIILAPIIVSPLIVFHGFIQFVFVSLCVCIGLPVLWYGVYGEKFKNRKKEPPRSSPITEGNKTGLVGVGIVFFSLFVGTIGLYAGRNPVLIGLFVLLFVIGTLLLYISSYMMRKEREKALHNG